MLKKIFIVVFTGVFSADASVNPAGQLVTRFGVNGTATLSLTEGNVQLNNVVVDSLQRIIVVGKVTSVGALVARFTAAGQLDTTFNTVGYRIFTYNGSSDTATCVGLFGSTIYVGCYDGATTGSLFIASFTDTGSFNNSWGTNGVYAFNIASATQKRLTALLVQTDGKIVIGGSLDSPNGYVARTNTIGTALDTTFNASGTPGYQVLSGFFVVPSMIFLSSQRIGVTANNQSNSVIYSFTSAGVPDTSFNSTGVSEQVVGVILNSVLLQSTGCIVAVGPDTSGRPSVLGKRFTPTGQIDTTFGNAGTATLLSNSTCYSAAMVSINDNFFVGCLSFDIGGVVVAVSANGPLDSSFGTAGVARFLVTPYALSPSSNGTMLSVGHNFTNGYIQQFTQYDTGQVGFTNSSTSVSSTSSSSGYVVGVAPVYKVPVTNTDVLPDYVVAGLTGF